MILPYLDDYWLLWPAFFAVLKISIMMIFVFLEKALYFKWEIIASYAYVIYIRLPVLVIHHCNRYLWHIHGTNGLWTSLSSSVEIVPAWNGNVADGIIKVLVPILFLLRCRLRPDESIVKFLHFVHRHFYALFSEEMLRWQPSVWCTPPWSNRFSSRGILSLSRSLIFMDFELLIICFQCFRSPAIHRYLLNKVTETLVEIVTSPAHI